MKIKSARFLMEDGYTLLIHTAETDQIAQSMHVLTFSRFNITSCAI